MKFFGRDFIDESHLFQLTAMSGVCEHCIVLVVHFIIYLLLIYACEKAKKNQVQNCVECAQKTFVKSSEKKNLLAESR